MPLIAIRRSPRFAKSDADDAILLAVVHGLERQGQEVIVMTEPEFQESGVEGEGVFGMYREEKTLALLDKMQQRGVRVIPSPEAIRNARREHHVRMLTKAGVPMPAMGDVGFPCWLKKAQGWTETPDDVIFCEREFPKDVNLENDIVQQHIEGKLVKFYGVEGTDFFYPSAHERLRDIATKASRVLSLPIYGGDAIISPDGDIYLIDFNDWPSFAICREEAAKAIAKIIKRSYRGVIENLLRIYGDNTFTHSSL